MKCVNCSEELEEKDGKYICHNCDVILEEKQNKKVELKKGKIQELEEELAEQKITLDKIIKFLFGKDEKDIWED